MENISPADYEKLVAEIASGMRQSAPALAMLTLGEGRTNRILGASGYNHQIDVSLVGPRGMFLIECKRWRKRAGVESVLVLAARASDILQAHRTSKVTPILISSVGFTRGAKQIANHYGVRLELVVSAQAFGLQLGAIARIGAHDVAVAADHAETFHYRGGKPVDG